MTTEKKVMLFHIILFVICCACVAVCKINYNAWYYRMENPNMLFLNMLFARPLLCYSFNFMLLYVVARKTFREDLQLPHKGLRIAAMVMLLIYFAAVGIVALHAYAGSAVLPKFYYYAVMGLLNCFWLLSIPGILLGITAEKHWRKANV